MLRQKLFVFTMIIYCMEENLYAVFQGKKICKENNILIYFLMLMRE